MASITDSGAGREPSGQADLIAALQAEVESLRAELAERAARVDALEAGATLESQIRLVADALPVLIAYVDANERYLYNNRAYEHWFGGSRSRFLGQTLRDSLGPVAYARLQPLIARALGGEQVSADLSLEYAAGGLRHIHLDYVPDKRPDGRVAGFFSLVQDTSEAKRAEQTLRESEARFRAMADCAPVPVWVTNEKGIDFVSRTFLDLIGNSAEEVTGDAWMKLIHPDDLASVIEVRDRSWQTGAAYSYEARFRLDKGERWMHVSSSPRLDEDGKLIGYVGMAVDFTDQKHAELELRESEARFRAIADIAPALIWVTDESGIIFANRPLLEFAAMPSEQFLGPAWLSFVHPEDAPEVGAQRDRAWAAQAPYGFEARFRRHDGEWRWLRAQCQPRESHDGFIGYVGLAIDITEERKAQAELRESESLLTAMFDSAGVGIGLLDHDWRIERANAAFCSIVGRPLDAIQGSTWQEISDAEELTPDSDGLAALESGSAYAFERLFPARDGRSLWLRITLSAVGSQWLAIVEDVTARKKTEVALRASEKALRELNLSLESRIEAAINEREAIEEALRQAQKMEAVGQLTGGIAHDFNNLLTVISGNLDLASRRLGADVDPRVHRAINSALAGADRAATLTQRLLAFSRRQPLAPRSIDANALLLGMSDLLHRTLGETVTVETRLAPVLWKIEVDPHQLEGAVLNLAVNGRDAMPEGGRITIGTGCVTLGPDEGTVGEEVAPGDYVEIVVADTGFGMDAETVRRSVEPFFTTKDVGKGTGLGLSMVYGFVRQSGGHLRIDSREGKGTEVRIFLPRSIGEVIEEKQAGVALAPRGSADETILVCEDDADVRAYTIELLTELGYRVIEAEDGESALAPLADADQRIDLLFTDVVLPGGISGAVLARRAAELRPGLKILYTTGYARDAIIQEGRLEPGIELIAKPFALGELAERVREVLDAA